MVRPSCVHDHPVKGPALLHDHVDCSGDAILLRDISACKGKTAGKLFGDEGEFFSRAGDVYGKDFDGAIGETAFCYAQADAAVCASDWWYQKVGLSGRRRE